MVGSPASRPSHTRSRLLTQLSMVAQPASAGSFAFFEMHLELMYSEASWRLPSTCSRAPACP
eukprot:2696234-Prorocentrum_lima.AAC.1